MWYRTEAIDEERRMVSNPYYALPFGLVVALAMVSVAALADQDAALSDLQGARIEQSDVSSGRIQRGL